MLKVLYYQKILEIFCNVKNDKLINYLLRRTGDLFYNGARLVQHREAQKIIIRRTK